MEESFVHKGSIVRKIWGKSDTVLLVFAGSAAEFALNRSVDWLYFTGRLPADPIGRLFSTVRYARDIIYSSNDRALAAIDQITAIHSGVEKSRGMRIPDSAYRDVLFMLIDYTIRSFELMERKLTLGEKAEIFDVFRRVGERMGLKGLPGQEGNAGTEKAGKEKAGKEKAGPGGKAGPEGSREMARLAAFAEWEVMRADHLDRDLVCSELTRDLYGRYRKSLGAVRYRILLGGQALLVPERVRGLLSLPAGRWMGGVILFYKLLRVMKLDRVAKAVVLPRAYRAQVAALDVEH